MSAVQQVERPPEEGNCYRLLRPRIGMDVTGWLVSDRISVLGTHWAQGRTRPHYSEDCPNCAPLFGKVRFNGYAFLWPQAAMRCHLIEVTPEAFKRCGFLSVNGNRGLRGQFVRLVRTGGHVRGPVRMQMEAALVGARQLPAVPSMKLTLSAMWGISIEDLAGLDEG